MAVIMPEVQRSFYCDMTNGPRYFTYIVDELPALCQRLFRVSARREDNFVAGLSMGGYGAMKAALSRPERYAAAASFSGAVDVAARLDSHPDIFQATCGGTLRAEDDLFRLAEKTAGERPRLYRCVEETDIDPCVGALGRKAGGDEELERVGIGEGTDAFRVALLQLFDGQKRQFFLFHGDFSPFFRDVYKRQE